MQFLRRRRRRKQVLTILGVEKVGVRAESLEGLNDQHLASLATIASSVQRTSARGDLREIFPNLLTDARRTRDIAEAGKIAEQLHAFAVEEKTRREAVAKRQRLARSLFEQVSRELNPQLTEWGCRADEDKCVKLIESFLKSEPEVDKVLREFSERFRKRPTDLVDKPEVLFRHQAVALYRQIQPQVMRFLPQGARLNRSPCEDLLTTMLSTGTPPDKIFEQFVSKIRLGADTYVSGVTLPSPDEIAANIYQQIENSFIAALPSGCTPKRDECIKGIALLVSGAVSADDIVKFFMKCVEAMPSQYLHLPKPQPIRMSSYSSSAPVSMERSELRR